MIVQIICRDLWALHLSSSPSPPPPEPLLHQQATQGHINDHVSEEIDTFLKKASPELSGASTPEGDNYEVDAEIEEMLRALSESSSSEDEEGEPRPKPEGGGRKLKLFGHNGPASNIALLMIGCWTLRLPIMYLDLIRFDCRMESRLADVAECLLG